MQGVLFGAELGGLGIPAKADAFGFRGQVNVSGTGTALDGSYLQRNNVATCGPNCVTGTGAALFKADVRWRIDNSTTPATITIGSYTGPATTNNIAITYKP